MENNNSTKGFLHPLTDARIFMAEAMKHEDAEAKKCEERKTDRQVVINDAEEVLSHVLPDEKDTSGIMVKVGWVRNVLALLEKQAPKEPGHFHEEKPVHEWKKNVGGEPDEFAWMSGVHNGPVCERCGFSFCEGCNPNGWTAGKCVVDYFFCPNCRKQVDKGQCFCDDCGQEMKWDYDFAISDSVEPGKYTELQLKALWSQFEDIPVDPVTGLIEVPFLHFGPGTHREEIWKWFDEVYPNGVNALVCGE